MMDMWQLSQSGYLCHSHILQLHNTKKNVEDSRIDDCYDLKLELRLHLGKDLREVKEDCINSKT